MSTKTIKTMANLQEIWKQIPNYPDYFASTHGRIKSIKNGKEKILNTNHSGEGYIHAALCVKGKYHTKRARQWIALTFIPNPQNLPQINHKDCNKSNNNIDNLGYALGHLVFKLW